MLSISIEISGNHYLDDCKQFHDTKGKLGQTVGNVDT